jgi:predicted nucleotidyltransferase
VIERAGVGPGSFGYEACVPQLGRFLDTLARAVKTLAARDVRFGAIGGLAAVAWGRPRWDPASADIDLMVRPQDAEAAQAALVEESFEAVATNEEHWLRKVSRDGVGVDLIFRTAGDIYLDDDMIARVVERDFEGVGVPVVSAEDTVVMKALAFGEQTPTYWAEALSILARHDLDWDYVLRRARHGVHRVLSLLVYAQSQDLAVPASAVRALFAAAEEEGGTDEGGERWEDPPTRLPTT